MMNTSGWQTMETCRKNFFSQMMGSQSKPMALTINDQTSLSCSQITLIVALVLVCVAILTNIINIVTFTKKAMKGAPVLLWLALAISDLTLILVQLPYLGVKVSKDQVITADIRISYNTYLISRHVMNYICITFSAWILVTAIAFKLRQQNKTAENYGSDSTLDHDMLHNEDPSTDNKTQAFVIFITFIVSTGIHVLKAFEYENIQTESTPTKLRRKSSFNVTWYRIFTLIANLCLTFGLPYLINIVVAIYCLYRTLLLKMKGRNDAEKMRVMLLCFTLGFLFCLCYVPVICIPVIELVQHARIHKKFCLEGISECLIYLYCGIKFLLYLSFTNMRKDICINTWKCTFLKGFQLRKQSMTLVNQKTNPFYEEYHTRDTSL